MAITLRYFTEFGKTALQKTICGGIYARVYCILSACTMSSYGNFTFAISSPDEFLVVLFYDVLTYFVFFSTHLQFICVLSFFYRFCVLSDVCYSVALSGGNSLLFY